MSEEAQGVTIEVTPTPVEETPPAGEALEAEAAQIAVVQAEAAIALTEAAAATVMQQAAEEVAEQAAQIDAVEEEVKWTREIQTSILGQMEALQSRLTSLETTLLSIPAPSPPVEEVVVTEVPAVEVDPPEAEPEPAPAPEPPKRRRRYL